jgi:soluble lytic murein transglycosylase-like protein
MIAKPLFVTMLATAALFLPFSGASASLTSAAHTPVHETAASDARSELKKEQAMSPSQLLARWAPLIKEASRRFGIAESWIKAVMSMESGGRTVLNGKRPITSNAGAMGIMQIMPNTYREMRDQHGLGANPYDPRDNVLAGTAYLRALYEKYGYPAMFAAYNAGPGTFEAHAAGGRKLPNETRAYVSGIARILGTEAEPLSSPPSQPAKIVATLTRPDGSTISIDGAAVESIRASMPDEYAPSVQTVLAMGNVHQGVREDLATVASLLKRQSGKV